MCFSGKCNYENYWGGCSIRDGWKIPDDAQCALPTEPTCFSECNCENNYNKHCDRGHDGTDDSGCTKCDWHYLKQSREGKTSEWINVKDRLPERPVYDWVLVQAKLVPENWYGVPHIAELRRGVWYSDGHDTPLEETCGIVVTHWMPLPDKPKQKNVSCCECSLTSECPEGLYDNVRYSTSNDSDITYFECHSYVPKTKLCTHTAK